MAKMSDEALIALLNKKEDSAAAYVHGELATARETAHN